jgi:hypothetical protein
MREVAVHRVACSQQTPVLCLDLAHVEQHAVTASIALIVGPSLPTRVRDGSTTSMEEQCHTE